MTCCEAPSDGLQSHSISHPIWCFDVSQPVAEDVVSLNLTSFVWLSMENSGMSGQDSVSRQCGGSTRPGLPVTLRLVAVVHRCAQLDQRDAHCSLQSRSEFCRSKSLSGPAEPEIDGAIQTLDPDRHGWPGSRANFNPLRGGRLGFGVLEAQMELVCVGTTGRNRSGTLAGSLCHSPVRQAGRVCRRGQLRRGFAEGQHSAETRARQTDPISGGRRKTAWKGRLDPGLVRVVG
jgi:hypothetical protein